jgi:hypothetical protein
MDATLKYSGEKIAIKGRSPATLTSVSDVGGAGLLTDQAALLNTAAALDFASSAAADAIAGTGARTIRLIGLGADKLLQTEDIDLAGQTRVTTTKTWYRVFWIQVTVVGTGGVNAGDIYFVKTGTGGTWSGGVPPTFTAASAIAKILAGTNQNGEGTYSTPDESNYQWVAKRISLAALTQPSTFILQSSDGGPYLRDFYFNVPAGSSIQLDLSGLLLIYKKNTDLRLLCLSASAGGVATAYLELERQSIAGIGA